MNQTDPRPTSEEPLLNQVRLGGSGVHVSRLALGMMSFGDTSKRAWVLDEHAAEPIVRRAIEGGITFFDTSDFLNKPDLTAPILGATKLAHIDDGLAATAIQLSTDEIALLEEPYVPRSVIG
jgi:aryl-alcohol dehydrogenase-like predicted oxidoreductase